MGYPGEVPMHSFTCIMGFPETPLLPFRAGFSCGKAIYNERRLAADIFRLIPRNEHAAFGEMLARELRGREVPDHELRRIAERAWHQLLKGGLANLRRKIAHQYIRTVRARDRLLNEQRPKTAIH
jgi:hypothetical protein